MNKEKLKTKVITTNIPSISDVRKQQQSALAIRMGKPEFETLNFMRGATAAAIKRASEQGRGSIDLYMRGPSPCMDIIPENYTYDEFCFYQTYIEHFMRDNDIAYLLMREFRNEGYEVIHKDKIITISW